MKGVYTVTGQIAGLSANKTVFQLTAPNNKLIELVSFAITQSSTPTNAQHDISLSRVGSQGSTTGYTTPTPAPTEIGDQAAGATAFLGSGTSGEPTTLGVMLLRRGVPSLVGFIWEPSCDEERLFFMPNTIFAIKINNGVPVTGEDVDIRVMWKEIG